uniref:Uncharacterized protein n=1 Tax=Anguilla anguilla TaxID=7936 RepID=A0A0E9XJH8_ANGAN
MLHPLFLGRNFKWVCPGCQELLLIVVFLLEYKVSISKNGLLSYENIGWNVS